jgi:hypothetical protein
MYLKPIISGYLDGIIAASPWPAAPAAAAQPAAEEKPASLNFSTIR